MATTSDMPAELIPDDVPIEKLRALLEACVPLRWDIYDAGEFDTRWEAVEVALRACLE